MIEVARFVIKFLKLVHLHNYASSIDTLWLLCYNECTEVVPPLIGGVTSFYYFYKCIIIILSNHCNFGNLYKEFILSSISKSVRVEFETSNIKLCDCFSCFSIA